MCCTLNWKDPSRPRWRSTRCGAGLVVLYRLGRASRPGFTATLFYQIGLFRKLSAKISHLSYYLLKNKLKIKQCKGRCQNTLRGDAESHSPLQFCAPTSIPPSCELHSLHPPYGKVHMSFTTCITPKWLPCYSYSHRNCPHVFSRVSRVFSRVSRVFTRVSHVFTQVSREFTRVRMRVIIAG